MLATKTAGFNRTASNIREGPLMRPSLFATADNSKTKNKSVAKCSDTTRLYSRDFNSVLCIPWRIFFFPPYEGKPRIKIVDGKRRKLRRVMRERHRRVFRKKYF